MFQFLIASIQITSLSRQLSTNQKKCTNWDECDITINCRLVGGPFIITCTLVRTQLFYRSRSSGVAVTGELAAGSTSEIPSISSLKTCVSWILQGNITVTCKVNQCITRLIKMLCNHCHSSLNCNKCVWKYLQHSVEIVVLLIDDGPQLVCTRCPVSSPVPIVTTQLHLSCEFVSSL